MGWLSSASAKTHGASSVTGAIDLAGRPARCHPRGDRYRQPEVFIRCTGISADGRLLGLLCLKASDAGFCSDEDVGARARELKARTTPK